MRDASLDDQEKRLARANLAVWEDGQARKELDSPRLQEHVLALQKNQHHGLFIRALGKALDKLRPGC